LRDEHELVSVVEALREESQILSTVPILVLHAHSSCNCRCIMCDIWKAREQKKIGVRDIEPQLESIRRLGVRWIVFSGGEPLMNSELPEMCSLLRAEGIRLTLLSTGLLLKKCAAEVVESFNDVIVSLDGPREIHDGIRRVPGAFDLLHAGIRALRNRRPDIEITARSTVQKANHGHLMETVHAAKELQLDGISFLAVDVTSTAFNRSLVWPVSRQTEIGLSLAELGVLENEIESLIAASGRDFEPGFVAESPQKLRRLARHFRAQLGLAAPESPLCNAPWVSAVIEADGSVRPCFFHPSIGKLSGTTLEAVINGPEGRGFRSTLDVADNPICRNCVCSLNYRT
jgi:MoaA/NifB/PqqE/SkfB family radical SAM enzyme